MRNSGAEQGAGEDKESVWGSVRFEMPAQHGSGNVKEQIFRNGVHGKGPVRGNINVGTSSMTD